MIWTNGRTASKIDIPECITQLLVSYSRALLLISIQKLTAFPWLTSFAGLKLGFPLFKTFIVKHIRLRMIDISKCNSFIILFYLWMGETFQNFNCMDFNEKRIGKSRKWSK